MSDGSLSQDEIDALLQGSDTIDFDADMGSGSGNMGGASLSDQEISAISQVLGSVSESQTSNLSMLAGESIKIGKPSVTVKSRDQLMSDLPGSVVEIHTDFSEGLSGEHLTLFDESTALKIASAMLGQGSIDLNEMAFSTLGEAVSNIMGPALTSIGNKIGSTITCSPPSAHQARKSDISLPPGDEYLCADYPLAIGGKTAVMTDIYAMNLAKDLGSLLGGGGSGGMNGSSMSSMGGMDMGDVADSVFPPNAFGGTNDSQQNMKQNFTGMMGGNQANPPNVQSVQFPNLSSNITPTEQGNIGLLMDVYMEMTVELGRTKKLIKEILGIGEGTIIELDKLAGEPVDILVNHKLIAKGEVVVIDENFGVRVTEIVSPMERMGDLP